MNRLRYWGRVANYLLGFGLYAGLCLIMMPIAFVLISLPRGYRTKSQSWARALVRRGFAFVRCWCRLSGFVDMRLIDHSQGQASRLMIANHLTMFDIVLLFGYVPNLQTLVNAKFAQNPLMALAVRACGYIPLKVGNAAEGVQAFARLEESLHDEEPVVLFPEGTRSADGNLGRMKKGAFRLADDLELRPSFLFFTCSQAFLNKAAFFPKRDEPVILEAHLFAAEEAGDDIEALFKKRYGEFRSSSLSLAWNSLGEKT